MTHPTQQPAAVTAHLIQFGSPIAAMLNKSSVLSTIQQNRCANPKTTYPSTGWVTTMITMCSCCMTIPNAHMVLATHTCSTTPSSTHTYVTASQTAAPQTHIRGHDPLRVSQSSTQNMHRVQGQNLTKDGQNPEPANPNKDLTTTQTRHKFSKSPSLQAQARKPSQAALMPSNFTPKFTEPVHTSLHDVLQHQATITACHMHLVHNTGVDLVRYKGHLCAPRCPWQQPQQQQSPA